MKHSEFWDADIYNKMQMQKETDASDITPQVPSTSAELGRL